MSSRASQLLDRVIARVGTASITLTDVQAAIGLGLVEPRAGEDPLASAVSQMIDRELQLAEVRRFPPPDPSDAEIVQQVDAMKARAGARFETLTQDTGLDEARMRELARDTLRIQAYLRQRFGTVQVGQDEARRYYQSHPAEFTRDGALIPYEQAEPIARQRAAAERLRNTIAQWLRDLRGRAEVVDRTNQVGNQESGTKNQ